MNRFFKVYLYDVNTKEYLMESVAMVDPITGEEKLPPGSTKVAPLEFSQYQKSIFDGNKQTWNVVSDYRNIKVYNKNTLELITKKLGEDLSSNETLIEPPILAIEEFPFKKVVWNETFNNWEKVNDVDKATDYIKGQRDVMLRKTDWLILRHKDELERGITTILTSSQYQELLTYRQQLRDLPNQPNFDPFNVVWPTKPIFVG